MLKFRAVGADPELFFQRGNLPWSVEGMLGGTKMEPLPMVGLPEGFAIQEDNVAAEFNIPPCTSSKEFTKAIRSGVKYIDKIAKENKLDLAIVSAMNFPVEQLMTDHAQMLGCEPDFNAWTGKTNPRPRPPKTLRTAAGHVHISWEDPQHRDKLLVGKTCDVMLGIPSLLVTKKNERRSLYGKAGAVRFKEYGIEYRTLDNFWIAKDNYCRHVFDMVYHILSTINHEGDMHADLLETWEEEIQQCINTHDLDMAVGLMEIFHAPAFPYVD